MNLIYHPSHPPGAFWLCFAFSYMIFTDLILKSLVLSSQGTERSPLGERTWHILSAHASRVKGEHDGRQHSPLQGTRATRGGGAGDQLLAAWGIKTHLQLMSLKVLPYQLQED